MKLYMFCYVFFIPPSNSFAYSFASHFVQIADIGIKAVGENINRKHIEPKIIVLQFLLQFPT